MPSDVPKWGLAKSSFLERVDRCSLHRFSSLRGLISCKSSRFDIADRLDLIAGF